MDRRARGCRSEPSDHFFGTATGRRRDPDRFRDRILARARRAGERGPSRRRPGAAAADHAPFAAADLGDVLRR